MRGSYLALHLIDVITENDNEGQLNNFRHARKIIVSITIGSSRLFSVFVMFIDFFSESSETSTALPIKL